MSETLVLPRFDAKSDNGEVTFAAQATGLLAFIEQAAGNAAQLNGVARRLRKGTEELGEVSEAYLNLTGHNGKKKVAADLLEEAVDVFIVAADTLLEYLRWLASEPDLTAVHAVEEHRLKEMALSCLRTATVPGDASTHEDRYWAANEFLLLARTRFRQVSAFPPDSVARMAAGDAFVHSFYASLQLMYTFVDGLSTSVREFDLLVIGMLEQKLTKWVTALSRGSNAVQQA